jgi:hypothetical protein
MRMIKIFAYMVFTMLLPLWLFQRANEKTSTTEVPPSEADYRAENSELRSKSDELLKENGQLLGANDQLKTDNQKLQDDLDAALERGGPQIRTDKPLPAHLPPMFHYLQRKDETVPVPPGVDSLLIRDPFGDPFRVRLEQPSGFDLTDFSFRSKFYYRSTKYFKNDTGLLIPASGQLILDISRLRLLPDPIVIQVADSGNGTVILHQVLLKIERN